MRPPFQVFLLLLGFSLSQALPASTKQAGQTLAAPPFYATSFDCAKAKVLSTEEGICKNRELAELDIEASRAYKDRLAKTSGPEKVELVDSQRRWLMIRNSYNLNPYHGDPAGMASDLASFYRERVAALRSQDSALLHTEIPADYQWLRATAPLGFDQGFFISRAHAGCDDPCRKAPALYRWISINGHGTGEEPGDVDTPYAQLVKKLAAEGWAHCREADDSSKPTIEYFVKNEKMVAVFRYYSMGAGNSISFGITISAPLPQRAAAIPNPTITITDDWGAYSDPDVGLKVRFPADWHAQDRSPTRVRDYKYLMFGADDFKPGDFHITIQPERTTTRPININNEDPAPRCGPSHYRIAGLAAEQCLHEGEIVSEGTCERYIEFVDIAAGKYHLIFEPSGAGSYESGSDEYKLTDLYEKIMSTIEIK